MKQHVFQSLLVDHIWSLLLLQRIFSEVPVLMLLYSNVDYLHGCFSCFRALCQQVLDSAYNLTFKLLFIVAFFRMFHNKKCYSRSNVKYRTFSEGPTRSALFLLKLKSYINCPKIRAETLKIVKFLIYVISEHT